MHDGCGIAGADAVLGIPPMECHHQVCPSSSAFSHNPTSVTRSVQCVGNGGEMRRKDLLMAPVARGTLRGPQNSEARCHRRGFNNPSLVYSQTKVCETLVAV